MRLLVGAHDVRAIRGGGCVRCASVASAEVASAERTVRIRASGGEGRGGGDGRGRASGSHPCGQAAHLPGVGHRASTVCGQENQRGVPVPAQHRRARLQGFASESEPHLRLRPRRGGTRHLASGGLVGRRRRRRHLAPHQEPLQHHLEAHSGATRAVLRGSGGGVQDQIRRKRHRRGVPDVPPHAQLHQTPQLLLQGRHGQLHARCVERLFRRTRAVP